MPSFVTATEWNVSYSNELGNPETTLEVFKIVKKNPPPATGINVDVVHAIKETHPNIESARKRAFELGYIKEYEL